MSILSPLPLLDVLGQSTTRSPLILGEVLFDFFPNGSRVLGGAPFNVAWNLRGFGLRPRFVSAVGKDGEADEIRRLMAAWGLDQTGLQTCFDRPTGKVQVTVQEGEPSYRIVPDCAYDFVRQPEWPVSVEHFSLFYFGSLACRNEVTRETIGRVKANSGLPTFVDVNIRSPWFDNDWLPELLGGAAWVKLNRDELAQVTDSSCHSAAEVVAATDVLRRRYGCQSFWVTCGADGAYAISEEVKVDFAEAPQPPAWADSVGAGDAFASVVIYGIHQGWPQADTLRKAVAFASRVCGINGAICSEADFYGTVGLERIGSERNGLQQGHK